MKKILIKISLVALSFVANAKIYATIESITIDGRCRIVAVSWWDDNGTLQNSADDMKLGTDFIKDCNK